MGLSLRYFNLPCILNWNLFLQSLCTWCRFYLNLNVSKQKIDIHHFSIVLMFQTSTSSHNIRIGYIQQPIAKLVLGHLVLEEEDFVNIDSTIEKT
jgi:hypothetical protein